MPEAWIGREGLATVTIISHLTLSNSHLVRVDNTIDPIILFATATQEYCSVSIATVLLRSWGGPYVRWTRWRNIRAFAFAAANRSNISSV